MLQSWWSLEQSADVTPGSIGAVWVEVWKIGVHAGALQSVDVKAGCLASGK